MPTMPSPPVVSRRRAAGVSVIAEALQNRGFVACAALLLAFTIAFRIQASKMHLVKDALPPQHKMNELKQERLVGYKLLHVPPMQSDVLNQLGTEDVVQWLLQEWDANKNQGFGPLVSLFVTYYTGMPDAVPHVPEVCYEGNGFTLVSQTGDDLTISSRGREETIPIQVLEFRKTGQLLQGERIVVYTFHANGQFRRDRTAVRLAIGNLTDRYAYFSKVEVGVGVEPGVTSKQQAIESAERLLRVAVPVLLEDHWPDWQKATKAPASRPAAAQGIPAGADPPA
jgi:hypothetical protein